MTQKTHSEITTFVNPTPRRRFRYWWHAPGGEWHEGLPAAREVKAIGATVQVCDYGGFNKFFVSHRDNWGDERFAWRVSANVVVGTDGPHDMPLTVGEFATFRDAIADARRRIRERDYESATC